jgi:2'-5' RNA ligase
MTETWRLFIALELPSEVKDGLEAIRAQLARQAPPRTVRWVQPDGIHLTLKFLGDAPVARRDELQAALQVAVDDHAPFPITAGDLGCFPNPQRPRVVWVGIREDTGALASLRDSVEKHVAPLGFPTENRPFTPHLTLGRVNRDASRSDLQKLGGLISATAVGDLHTWPVTAASLMRSELKPTGAVYTALHHAALRSQPDV